MDNSNLKNKYETESDMYKIMQQILMNVIISFKKEERRWFDIKMRSILSGNDEFEDLQIEIYGDVLTDIYEYIANISRNLKI